MSSDRVALSTADWLVRFNAVRDAFPRAQGWCLDEYGKVSVFGVPHRDAHTHRRR